MTEISLKRNVTRIPKQRFLYWFLPPTVAVSEATKALLLLQREGLSQANHHRPIQLVNDLLEGNIYLLQPKGSILRMDIYNQANKEESGLRVDGPTLGLRIETLLRSLRYHLDT